jgi:uncharacterized protein (TIGR02145 family)
MANSIDKFNFKHISSSYFLTRGFFSCFLLFVLFLHSCQEREFVNPFDPQVPKTLSTSVLPSGAGRINVSPSAANYKTDQVITLTPEPNQHWVFKNWEGDANGNAIPFNLTMSTNKSVVAVFVKRNYPLNLTTEGEGTVGERIVFTPSGREYPHGTIVELTPIPKQGWLFDSWSGDLTGKNVPQNITVDNPKNVKAKFVQQQISNLACASALNNGNLVATLPANGVSSSIPYTTVAGGSYVGQSITSTGVTGLTATLTAGSFSPVSGNLTFNIVGIPSGVGTASFALSVGGQTCTFTRAVNPIGTITGLNCAGATPNGALISGVAASNVNSVIPYTGGNGSVHLGQIVPSTGVTGLTATLAPGSFVNGNGTLTYTITGTPSAIGNATFALSVGGQTCTLTRVVSQLVGSISTLNCSPANTGALTQGTTASGVSSTYNYTGGNGGPYASQSVSSTGVGGLTATLAAGTFANGNGSLNYTITGTPSGFGTASFALSIGGQTCTLTRAVSQLVGSISTLNCSPANTGALTQGTMASGVSSTYTYTGGNGGPYTSQSVSSTGVGGLTATLAAGTFANGNGSLAITITGTPSGFGTASFSLNIGGRTCTLTRAVSQLVAAGSINLLACGSATNTGTLTQGVPAAGVSSSVPYSGGNGGNHSGQSVSSTGVTGLTATLAAGTFTANTGSLNYTITGTPTGNGTASFVLNIGGQICVLTRTVTAAVTATYPNGTYCSNIQSAIFEVTTITGRTWMDRNLGATKAAASSTEVASFGDLYQWGRRSDGHQCRNSATTTTLSSTNSPSTSAFIIAPNAPNDWRNPQFSSLWQGASGTNNPCPSGYRLPTSSEFNAEIQAWGNKNAAGAMTSPLKLPTAAIRDFENGQLILQSSGVYWTSTINGTNSNLLLINNSEASLYIGERGYGASVRCIKN